MKGKKNSNIEKEMIYVLHLLNEDDSNANDTTEEEAEKTRVFIDNDVLKKIIESITGKNIKLGQLVKLNANQLNNLTRMFRGLKRHDIIMPVEIPIENSPEYHIFSTIKDTDILLKQINKQVSRRIERISSIGSGVGIGITVAGWAIARARLQKQLKKCGNDLICAEEVKAKIRKLNTIALWSGLGLETLGSHVATHFYNPSL